VQPAESDVHKDQRKTK